MNPIVPAKPTQMLVSKVVKTKIVSLSLFKFSPIEMAVSSLSKRTSSCLDLFNKIIIRIIIIGAVNRIFSNELREKEPICQKIIFCILSLLKNSKSEFSADVKKLIARPDSNIIKRDVLFLPASEKINRALRREKIKANKKVPQIPLIKANKLNTLATVTPKAAPEDIPNR